MKLKLLSGSFLALLLNTSVAQEEFSVTNMGGGGFTVGYGTMNISELQAFVPGSVPGFNRDQILLGGVGHGFIGRLVLGGGGSGITGNRFATDSLRGSVSGGFGTFDIGYAVINKKKLKLFPMLGIGGGGYGVTITKTGSLSVKNILDEPGRGINISNGGIVADFSLNLYTIPALAYDKTENSYGGFMIGLKVGYLYSVPTSTWTYSGGDVVGGPTFGLNMPYVRLVLGGFGFQKTL